MGGAFYLDREPQVKHIAGPFFTEGSYTKNTVEEVNLMMSKLDDWANGRRPTDLIERNELLLASAEARKAPLSAMDRPIELARFMGKWYVILNIPTYFDRDTGNNIEEYSYNEETQTIHVDFTYCDKAMSKTSQLKQQAKVQNELNTQWSLSPKLGVYLPLKIPYLVADCAEDYSTTIIGVPDRSYVWVMARTPNPDESIVEALTKKAQLLGYDVSKLVRVPQKWDSELPMVETPSHPETASGA